MNWARKKALEIVTQLTLQEKIGLLSNEQKSVKRLNISAFSIGGEAAHGIVDREQQQTTSFPIPLTLSQTWNPSLTQKIGTVISDEARALYNLTGRNHWLMPWAPTIDLERDPRWGRNEEGYGEDPYLTGEMSGGLINGFQGDDGHFLKIAAAPKHFFGNNNEDGRGSKSNTFVATMKHEYYLKPFQFAFCKYHAQSMMTAYNGINGIPGMESPEIKRVKQDWQMDGCIVTDGGALTINLEDFHYYDNYPQAVADALKKGIDCFVDQADKVEKAAKEALELGLIEEKDIDCAITNTLKVRIQLGQVEPSVTPYDKLNKNDIGTLTNDLLVQKVYAEGSVLLKNQNQILPLSDQQPVLLTGPCANLFVRDWYATLPRNRETVYKGLSKRLKNKLRYVCCNDYANIQIYNSDNTPLQLDQMSFEVERWQNNIIFLKDRKSKRYLQYNEEGQLLLHGLEVSDWVVREAFYLAEDNLFYAIDHSFEASDINSLSSKGIMKPAIGQLKIVESGNYRVKSVAQNYQTTIFVGGNHPMINARETEDRRNLELAPSQRQICDVLSQSGTNTVAVILGGYSFILKDLPVSAILFTGYAGQSLGTAISKILFGDMAPTGKLSQTWYNREWQSRMPAITDYDIEKSARTYQYVKSDDVDYPFGYGLTYGKITIINVILDYQNSFVRVKLRNYEENSVTETIQIYLHGQNLRYRKNRKQLIAFEKITVPAGEIMTVNIPYSLNDFMWYDPRTKKEYWPEGNFQIEVGTSSRDIQHQFPISFSETSHDFLLMELPAMAFENYKNVDLISEHQQYQLVKMKANSFVTYYDLILPNKKVNVYLYATESGTLRFFDGVTNQELNSVQYHPAKGQQKVTANLNCLFNSKVSLKIISSSEVVLAKISTIS